MRIFLIGYMGSGKTTIGRLVAERMNMNFTDMDVLIERKAGKSVSEIFSNLGEDKFRELERNCLLEVAGYEQTIISTGGGAPCFFDNMEIMNSLGDTIYICLTPKQLASRLRTTNLNNRPVLASYQGDDLEKFIASTLQKREIFYNQAKIKISGTDSQIADKIIKHLQGEF